jgi:hypothetical protein
MPKRGSSLWTTSSRQFRMNMFLIVPRGVSSTWWNVILIFVSSNQDSFWNSFKTVHPLKFWGCWWKKWTGSYPALFLYLSDHIPSYWYNDWSSCQYSQLISWLSSLVIWWYLWFFIDFITKYVKSIDRRVPTFSYRPVLFTIIDTIQKSDF